MASVTSAQNGPSILSSAPPPGSQLTEQLRQKMPGLEGATRLAGSGTETPAAGRSPMKGRSLSDASSRTPSSASPNPLNIQRTKDDTAVIAAPATPHRPDRLAHGLSLQMPSRMFGSPVAAGHRVPLSPKLDSSHIYSSPASVLPRRSRGLDFSRACTNLHHSTLAESSPDSSPVVLGRGVAIPNRRSTINSTGMGSPNMSGGTWQSFAHGDRTVISSSVSSVNMFESDTTSSGDEDEDESMHIIDREDPILLTPQMARPGNMFSTPFSPSTTQSPGGDWMGGLSAAKASLMSFQRARLRNGRSRHSSSSNSGNSSKLSPGPISPPVLKSVESSATGYFPREMSMSEVKSRRESLSLGTSDLHLSDLSDDENRLRQVGSPSSTLAPGATNIESGPHGVIRRPVTRRGNLLPKTKNFARIRAALLEEVAPVDFECQREAEVIRQVRESEGGELPPLSPSLASPLDSSDSHNLDATRDAAPGLSMEGRSSSSIFTTHQTIGTGRLSAFDSRYQTPPPPTNQPIGSSNSAATSDAMMQTPPSAFPIVPGQPSTSTINTISQLSNAAGPSRVEAEASRKNNKRRRDEMIDMHSFKRRAVSPGMCLQNSPIAASQPSSSGSSAPYFSKDITSRFEGGGQGQLPQQQSKNPMTSTSTSTPGKTGRGGEGGTMKRVGMQGMNETNDGLMNMSID